MATKTLTEQEQASRTSIAQIAMELQADLGQRLVAYATSNRSPQVIGRWARGEGTPQSDDAERRLRGLYVTYLILRGPEHARLEEPVTIRTWMMSANSHLGDQPPLEILRSGDPALAQLAARELTPDR